MVPVVAGSNPVSHPIFNMDSLEARIGYKFSNASLLKEALTHPSLAYETRQHHFDNQRLEYLGDAVIQLILTDELYHLFPKFSEGKLTKMRSRLVSRDGLMRFAEKIDLGSALLLGKGEAANGGSQRPSNLADALEALAGAIYLDGGFEKSREFILGNFRIFIEEIAREPDEINPKGKLQEHLQSIAPSSPTYRIVSHEGPDHDKKFIAEVSWENIELGRGEGSSKKEAETSAAANALAGELWKQYRK